MALQTGPECIISPMRVETLRETTFTYVTNQPTPFAELDRDLDPLLESLYAAKAQANLGETGPDIVRYYKAGDGEPDMLLMEVGIPVKAGTQPAGAAQVKALPPYRCASLLLWGSLVAHIVEAYEAAEGDAGSGIGAYRRVPGVELLLFGRRVAAYPGGNHPP